MGNDGTEQENKSASRLDLDVVMSVNLKTPWFVLHPVPVAQ